MALLNSQWGVGRNATLKCDMIDIGANMQNFYSEEGADITISIMDHEFHSCLAYQIFCATAEIHCDSNKRPWSEVKEIVEKVHKHVREHSKYSEIKFLLERNDLWDDQVCS